MKENKFADYSQAVAKKVDIIFYFVCPENLCLKEEAMLNIASKFAKLLKFNTFATRCGAKVQNPKSLFSELEALEVFKFDILYVSKESGECSVLAHRQKVQFVQNLKSSNLNSGLVAKQFIDSSESSYFPEYVTP